MDRRDTLSSHQSSAKHAACIMKDISKTKHMTGLMDKGIAKVNQNELDQYEELFNTFCILYLKSTGRSLTTHWPVKFKLKMAFTWAVTIKAEIPVLTLLKTISDVLHNVIDHM